MQHELHDEIVRAPAGLGLHLPAETLERQSGRAQCPRPCTPHPCRRHRASRRYGNARWFGQSRGRNVRSAAVGSQREQGAIQEFPNVPGIPSASSALVVCRFVWAFYSIQFGTRFSLALERAAVTCGPLRELRGTLTSASLSGTFTLP